MHRIITTIRFCIRIAAKMGIAPPPPQIYPGFTPAPASPRRAGGVA